MKQEVIKLEENASIEQHLMQLVDDGINFDTLWLKEVKRLTKYIGELEAILDQFFTFEKRVAFFKGIPFTGIYIGIINMAIARCNHYSKLVAKQYSKICASQNVMKEAYSNLQEICSQAQEVKKQFEASLGNSQERNEELEDINLFVLGLEANLASINDCITEFAVTENTVNIMQGEICDFKQKCEEELEMC